MQWPVATAEADGWAAALPVNSSAAVATTGSNVASHRAIF
jgi:hypothetical protein